MKQSIIGREAETGLLEECYRSGKAELVAVYGRRRIGKTFLVKNIFMDRLDFVITGMYDGSLKEELAIWNQKLTEHSGQSYPAAQSWIEAFSQLKRYIQSLKKDRIVIFIDELPWFDTPRSRFVKAFEQFWNDWASSQSSLMIIVCGSATTWMNENIITQKGGLHNRVTRKIKLSPFNLYETSQFLASKNIKWSDHQIAECYMILGGTPYYLDLLRKEYSLAQNIDFLFFKTNAELSEEYGILLKSLFKKAEVYRKTIEILGKNGKGMTRKELAAKIKVSQGGGLSTILENLENCDFIRSYSAFGKKSRDVMYQLCDMFILFNLRFVVGGKGRDESFWSNSMDNPARRAWSGYAFEQLCFNHIPQIKDCLGIKGVLSNVCSWSRPADKDNGVKGRQIDMLIERRDQVINICEAKFSVVKYVMTEKYLHEMNARMEDFRMSVNTGYALHLTMIASAGLARNAYSDQVQSVVTLKDLMKP